MTVRPRRALGAAVATFGLTVGALTATTSVAAAEPAVDATTCAGTPFMNGGSLAEDQHVTGKTVVRGTTPVDFEGTYLGSLDDEFGNGILLFEMTGPEITRADGSVKAGIWAGMSGSPVYTDDGVLVGSVSYGFNGLLASNIAGVTPAASLFSMEKEPAADDLRLRGRAGAKARQAGAPSGTMTKLQARRVLASSFGSAVGGAFKARTGLKRLGVDGTAGVDNSISGPFVAGGNVATSWSSGALTFAALGTVTAVCGDRVFAFGHPDENLGESRQTLHHASVVSVIPDGARSYKLGNIASAPSGAVLFDGNHGVYGRTDRTMASVPVTSTVRTAGQPGSERTHTTQVSETQVIAGVAATQVYAQLASQLGAAASAADISTTMTVTFTRNGSSKVETFTRRHRFTGGAYVVDGAADDAFFSLDAIQYGSTADVDIRSITTSSTVNATYANPHRLSKIQVRSYTSTPGATWTDVTSSGVKVKQGRKLDWRYVLTAPRRTAPVYVTGGTMTISSSMTSARITAKAQDPYADESKDDEDAWDDEDDVEPLTLDEVLAYLAAEPDGTVFDSITRVDRGRTSTRSSVRKATPDRAVVVGSVSVPLYFVK